MANSKLTKREYRQMAKELLDTLHEEYIKGARAMWMQIRREVSRCDLRSDGCCICICGINFLKKLEKRKSK